MKYIVFIFMVFVAIGTMGQEKKKPIYYFNPNWSPDGNKIVFESTRDGKSSIYTIQTDGSNLRRLTNAETENGQPRWSPNGKKIVFYSQIDGQVQLFLMKSDGSAQKKLTNINNLNYLPDFSPKGDYVAFQSCPEPSLIAYDIYIIRTNGSDSIRLTDGKNGYYSPKWSPNGKKIVFVRAVVPKRYYREMTRDEAKKMHLSEDIFTMDKDGTNLKNLTNNEINDTNPHWSKNGKTIYFMSERDGSPNVYAMNPDGMNVRKIADGKIVTDTSISPDETFFVYSKEASGKWGIYIYEIKSGKERLLIEN